MQERFPPLNAAPRERTNLLSMRSELITVDPWVSFLRGGHLNGCPRQDALTILVQAVRHRFSPFALRLLL